MDILTIQSTDGDYKVIAFKDSGGEIGVEISVLWVSAFGSVTRRRAIGDAQAIIQKAALPWLRCIGRNWVIDAVALLKEVPGLQKHEWLRGTIRIEPEHEQTTREVFDSIIFQERVVVYLTEDEIRESLMPIVIDAPPEISESLSKFKTDHPDPSKTAFIMMRFGNTTAHVKIANAIRETLRPFGITAVRADDKEYHDELWSNVRTYLHGCGLCVAVFERLQTNDFNPNVALEVGYMMAFRKPMCVLKDQTLPNLHTDLVGKLYRSFDPQNITETLSRELTNWAKERGL